MRSRASFFIALCALVICLSCQVAEVFDQWDHTAQTGSDTEYAFVVVALCVGVCYSLGWFAPEISALDGAAYPIAAVALDSFLTSAMRRASATLITASPPSIALRI